MQMLTIEQSNQVLNQIFQLKSEQNTMVGESLATHGHKMKNNSTFERELERNTPCILQGSMMYEVALFLNKDKDQHKSHKKTSPN